MRVSPIQARLATAATAAEANRARGWRGPQRGPAESNSRGRGGFLERNSKVEQVRAPVDLIAAVIREILRIVVGAEARSFVGQIAPL